MENLKKRKLMEFVTFIPGVNQTRMESQFENIEIHYYDQASFERDYNHEEIFKKKNNMLIENQKCLKEGDVIISNTLRLATIVGKENAGKVPSLNFTKVEFNHQKMDKNFFIYIFNAYTDFQRQKEKELQGQGATLRIPIKALNQMEIPEIPIEQQKKIGKAYFETLKIQGKLNHYTRLMEQFVRTVLEERLKGID